MKKKLLAAALVVAMLSVVVVSGSLAYFTDTDKETNAFTVGNVAIDLHEANNADTPAVDEAYQDWLGEQVLMPGDVNTNTIAKRVYVENTGDNDVYVRVHIAVPAILDDAQQGFDASQGLLHLSSDANFLGKDLWNWGHALATTSGEYFNIGDSWNRYTTTIDGIRYNVYVATYESVLHNGALTEDAMYQVYLDSKTTKEDIGKANEVLGKKWNVLVFAEGAQADGFTDAFTALNASFGVPSADNNPWVATAP